MNARSKAKKLFLVELDDEYSENEDMWPVRTESLTYRLDQDLIRTRTATNLSAGEPHKEGFQLAKFEGKKTFSGITSTTGGSSPSRER